MIQALHPASLAALLVLGASAGPLAAANERLRPGETLTSSLGPADATLPGHGPAKPFALVAETSGRLTIEVESWDFDPWVKVETEAGGFVAEDDNGGIEWGARVILDAKAGTSYRIWAAAASPGGAGELTVRGVLGEPPRLTGAQAADLGIAFQGTAAERAVARGDRAEATRHRLAEASLRRSRAQLKEARSSYESAASIAREIPDPNLEVSALLGVANVVLDTGDFELALKLHANCADLGRSLDDGAAHGAALLGLGMDHFAWGKLSDSRQNLEIALNRARLLRDGAAAGLALVNLGRLYTVTGDPARALDLDGKALESAREAGDSALELRALVGLGVAAIRLGNESEAQESLDTALAIAVDSGDRLGEAAALSGLGDVHSWLGEYSKAEQVHRKQLAIAREVGALGEEASALVSLGGVTLSLGRFREAREALEGARRRPMGARTGELYERLGLAQIALGSKEEACKSLESAVEQANGLGDRSAEVAARLALSAVQFLRGRLEEARQTVEKAVDLARSRSLQGLETKALLARARVLRALGDEALAQEDAEKALALSRSLNDRESEARSLEALALLHERRGDAAAARRRAFESADVDGRRGDEPSAASALLIAARAALAGGDVAAATAALDRAGQRLERLLSPERELAEALGRRSRSSEWGSIAEDIAAASLRAAGKDGAAAALAVKRGSLEAGRWKEVALLEGVASQRLLGRSEEATAIRRELRESLAWRDRALERVSSAVQGAEPEEILQALEAEARGLLEEQGGLARKLDEVSPRDAALDCPRGVEAEAVRRAVISKGAALIEYVEGVQSLDAYVLTGQGLHLVTLGDRESNAKDVETLLHRLVRPGASDDVRAIHDSGRALFDRLLAPALREAGDGIERLVILPSADVSGVPFEALVSGTHGSDAPRRFEDLAFVIDRFEVCYAPSTPVLVDLAARPPRAAPRRALLLADPSQPLLPGRAPEDRAAADRSEALAIARVFANPADSKTEAVLRALGEANGRPPVDALTTKSFDLYLGRESNRRRLSGNRREYSILHVAVPTRIDGESPQRSRIEFPAEESSRDDVTLADVLDLDLDASLVVLPECDAPQGSMRGGLGVQSVARALFHAGTRGVVAGLWARYPFSRQEVLEGLYRGALAETEAPARALREAKLVVRRSKVARSVPGGGTAESAHPCFWASLVFIGLPR